MPRLSDEDWRKVELDYRRGVLSIAEIGRKYNVSAQHVGRVAKERVWTRDLNDEVQAKARAMVLSADKNGNAPDYADFNLKQVTDAEAKRVAAVQRRHRNLAENLSKSAEQIVAELYGSPEDTFTKARHPHCWRWGRNALCVFYACAKFKNRCAIPYTAC
ncbi:hypothetical protein [Neisseria gonorrhoeae]